MPENDKPKIKIVDGRAISAATGKPIEKNRSGDYDAETIDAIARQGKKQGLSANDIWNTIAIGMQESQLGSKSDNVGQVSWERFRKEQPQVYNELQTTTAGLSPKEKEAAALVYMYKRSAQDAQKNGITDPNDEAGRIQAYNGYGKIGLNNDIGAKKLYGIDLTKNTIDMKRDKLYGKTIIDVRENILKKNPDIVNYMNSMTQPVNPAYGGITVSPGKPTAQGKMALTFLKDNQPIKTTEVDVAKFNNPLVRPQLMRMALDMK